MKTWKLISMLLLAFMVGACDDDPAVEEGNGGGSGSGSSDRVSASWGIESKTVLKNAGQVLMPVKLSNPTGKAVKVTVAAQQSDDAAIAREGIDFDLPEKVVTFPAGDTLAFLTVDLLDNGKVETDRTVVLNITGVYDGQVAAAKTCSLYIVNNAFVEFQYKNRETYEAAGTYKIPVLVTGELREATTFTVRVKEGGTALEGTHFVLPQTVFTLEPGATSAEVEIELIDDTEANEDRWFDLEIVSVTGSNATVGKSVSLCRVTIISEEVLKSVSFGAAEFSVEEGQTLQIPVMLDKAPAAGEAAVQVTISVKSTSTAIEGTDYNIVNKVLEFAPGQKMGEIEIKALENDILDVDRSFELIIRGATGANIGSMDACSVTILNNDFPIFAQESYTSEEDYGELEIPFTLTSALTNDVTLNVVCEAIDESAIEGKHFTLKTSEIILKAGESTGNVVFNIGYTKEWTNTPKFKFTITGLDGNNWEIVQIPIVVEIKQSVYRQLLGQWHLTSAFGVTSADVSLFCEKDDDFNKILSMKGVYAEGREDTYHLVFDSKTHDIQVILGENVNPGSSVKLGRWSDADTTPVAVYLNEGLNKLTWEEVGYLGGYFYNSNNELAWNYFLQNVVLDKIE